jgi:hypothetical protein
MLVLLASFEFDLLDWGTEEGGGENGVSEREVVEVLSLRSYGWRSRMVAWLTSYPCWCGRYIVD